MPYFTHCIILCLGQGYNNFGVGTQTCGGFPFLIKDAEEKRAGQTPRRKKSPKKPSHYITTMHAAAVSTTTTSPASAVERVTLRNKQY